MNSRLVEIVARVLGTLRMGRQSLPGQGRLVDGLGRLAGWMNADKAVVLPWRGVRFETDLTDRIQRQMWAGTYEPHVREFLNALLNGGNVYVDVGGHIGYHSVFASYKVGKTGQVYAFEADPGMFERLAGNLGQFPWAHATHAAVWDSTQELAFERSQVDHESGWGTVCKVRDLGVGEHLNVRAISLDDWFRSMA